MENGHKDSIHMHERMASVEVKQNIMEKDMVQMKDDIEDIKKQVTNHIPTELSALKTTVVQEMRQMHTEFQSVAKVIDRHKWLNLSPKKLLLIAVGILVAMSAIFIKEYRDNIIPDFIKAVIGLL